MAEKPKKNFDSQQEKAELVRRACGGCTASFDKLVERYWKSLYSFLYRKTGNVQDAEDLSQETFVKAFRNLHRYDDSYQFVTWLYSSIIGPSGPGMLISSISISGNARG